MRLPQPTPPLPLWQGSLWVNRTLCGVLSHVGGKLPQLQVHTYNEGGQPIGSDQLPSSLPSFDSLQQTLPLLPAPLAPWPLLEIEI